MIPEAVAGSAPKGPEAMDLVAGRRGLHMAVGRVLQNSGFT